MSEKAHVGDYLGIVEVESRLGVVFSLNVDSRRIPFAINPSTGTVSLDAPVDYEKSQSYNYTVFASSMVRSSRSGVWVVCLGEEEVSFCWEGEEISSYFERRLGILCV